MIPEAQWVPKKLDAGVDRRAFSDLEFVGSVIDKMVDSGASSNILICSENCGNGKTSWSIKLMLKYFNRIWHKAGFSQMGLFVNVTDYLLANKSNIGRPSKDFWKMDDAMTDVPFLVLDDLGSDPLTQYEQELVYNIIDTRFNKNLFTMFTSNCLENDMRQAIGDRLHSRVWVNSTVIALKGRDRRGQ